MNDITPSPVTVIWGRSTSTAAVAGSASASAVPPNSPAETRAAETTACDI
ncbi:hypothetical protein [Streptosporangium longisporum]